ncbi:MAG: tetratricopeptide repeat protein [Candidatus Obscuribacter sp.]|nr:tetratricopeptide repeat protein [Candidatus Obscuribacter sp.]
MNYQLTAAFSTESLRLFMIGLTLVHRGNYREAISIFHSVIDLERSTKGCQPSDLVTVYMQLGLTYNLIERHDLAFGSYEEALHLCEKHLPNSHFHASVLLRLFTLHVLLQDEPAARETGTHLLTMHEQHKVLDLPSQGTVLLKLGELEELSGELQKANSYFQRAILAFNQLLGEGNNLSLSIRNRCIDLARSSPQLLNSLLEKDAG